MFKKLKWLILLLLLSCLESHATFSVPDRPPEISSRISSPTSRRTFAHFALFVVSSSSDPSGSLQGAGGVGGLLCVIDGRANPQGEPYFPCFDANGNIVQYIDDEGNIVAAREYSPFGETTSVTGAMQDDFTFRFSTKYWDIETGLGYWGMRYYHPDLGRWLSRDPLGEEGGVLLYGFVGNGPVSGIDPLGLAPGGCWDPRTYFNSALLPAMGESAKNVVTGVKEGLAEAGNLTVDVFGYYAFELPMEKFDGIDINPRGRYDSRTLNAIYSGQLTPCDACKDYFANALTLGMAHQTETAIAYSFGQVSDEEFSKGVGAPAAMQLAIVTPAYLRGLRASGGGALYHYVPARMVRVIKGTPRIVDVRSIAAEGLQTGVEGKVWVTSMGPSEFNVLRIGGQRGFDFTLGRFPKFLRPFNKNFTGGYVVEILDTSTFRAAPTLWKRWAGQFVSDVPVAPENLNVYPFRGAQ